MANDKILRTSLLLISFLIIFCISLNAQWGSPSFESPEVTEDQSAWFRYYAPDAKEVLLSGQFLSERALMKKDSQGIWSVKVGPIPPDMYPYHFIVDGVSVADPKNVNVFPNEFFKASIVEITGDAPLVHTVRNVPHGKLTYEYYHSEILGERPVIVYTPPGYDESSNTKFPVLYLLHGTTDTEETWSKVGRANIIMDNLLYEDKVQPMIIVMPYGRAYPAISKSSGSLRNWDNLQVFEKDFFGSLMPFIEMKYRTINDRKSRAITGFSGGGGTSLYFGLNHQDKFSYVAGFAPGMRAEEFDRNNEGAFNNVPLTNENLDLFWIGVGTEDGLFEVNEKYMKVLDEKGIEYTSFITDGGHTWMNCKKFLSTLLPKLFITNP